MAFESIAHEAYGSFRTFLQVSDRDSKYSEKKSKYRFSFCNLVDFVINKTWGSATRRIFWCSPPPPSLPQQCLSYFIMFKIFQRKPDPYNLVEGCSCYIFMSVLVRANRGWLLGTTIESSGEAQKHHSDPCTWTSKRRKMYVQKLVIESIQ